MTVFFGMKYSFIFHFLAMSGSYQLLLSHLFMAVKANTICITPISYGEYPSIMENILTPRVTYIYPGKRR